MSTPNPRLVWPVLITADNQDFYFTDDLGNQTANLTPGWYHISGDGSTEYDLLKNLKDALDEASADTHTVSVDNGTVTISTDGGTLSLLWTNASMTFYGGWLGFNTGADDTGALSYASDYQHERGWYPEQPVLDDMGDMADAFSRTSEALGGARSTHRFGGGGFRTIGPIDFLPRGKAIQVSGQENESWEDVLPLITRGLPCYYYTDATDSATLQGLYLLRDQIVLDSNVGTRHNLGLDTYSIAFTLEQYEWGAEELVANNEFVIDGTGPPTFQDWTHGATVVVSKDEGDRLAGRDRSARVLGSGGTGTIYQDLAVTPSTLYRLLIRSSEQAGGHNAYTLQDTASSDYWRAATRDWGGVVYNGFATTRPSDYDEINILSSTGTTLRLTLQVTQDEIGHFYRVQFSKMDLPTL